MKSISVSEFKAHCLRLVREVQTTGESLLLTSHGEPTVVVMPASATKQTFQFGLFKGTGQTIGDIVSSHPEDWEAGI